MNIITESLCLMIFKHNDSSTLRSIGSEIFIITSSSNSLYLSTIEFSST